MAGLEMTTDPDGAYMIWLPRAARGHLPPVERWRAVSTTFEWKAGRRIATRPRRWPRLRSTAIERAGWSPDDIDLFIPHQANVRIIESVAKGLGLPMDKMFVNVDRYGNTSAASVGIASGRSGRHGTDQDRRQSRAGRLWGGADVRRRSRWNGRPIRSTVSAPRAWSPKPTCASRRTGARSIRSQTGCARSSRLARLYRWMTSCPVSPRRTREVPV